MLPEGLLVRDADGLPNLEVIGIHAGVGCDEIVHRNPESA